MALFGFVLLDVQMIKIKKKTYIRTLEKVTFDFKVNLLEKEDMKIHVLYSASIPAQYVYFLIVL